MGFVLRGTGRPSVPPLRRDYKPSGTGGSGTRPYGENTPGALVRQSQAQKLNRTSRNFCKPRAQWPGENSDPPLRFCAPEIFCLTQGIPPPVMRVWG